MKDTFLKITPNFGVFMYVSFRVMFKLVQFEDETCEVVPQAWFENDPCVGSDASLAFPPKNVNIRRLVKSCCSPDTTWQTFNVKVLYSHGKSHPMNSYTNLHFHSIK